MKNKIGIVGGGQLGRMLALAAITLGFEVTVLDPMPNCPASICAKQIVGSFKDADAIFKLAEQVDYLTFEIESANAEALNQLFTQGKQINPQPEMLALIKDKFAQKEFYQQHGIPCADSAKVTTVEDVKKIAKEFSYPLVLKARFDAYDGRGNAVIENESEIESAFSKLGGKNLYVERFVPFQKELAVMVARSTTDEVKSYPVVESIQKNNICHTVMAPAKIDPSLAALAQKFAEQVVSHLQGAGVFGIEMFLTNDNKILINEIAPRVHNSGHYTTEACVTSQFEQHIRAVCGLPLGDTAMKVSAAVMLNILGQHHGDAKVQGLENALALDGVNVHFYGKAETKPERKMGHLTAVADSVELAMVKAEQALAGLSI